MKNRMVTRTITATIYTCMVVNPVDNAVVNQEVTLASVESMTDRQVEKSIRTKLDTDGFLFVKVLSARKEETLYGMDEAEFIKLAKVLPARGTKAE